jgi:hypothetical protein
MAEEANGAQRITVSLDTLRTEIRLANAELELRLTQTLAEKDDLESIAARLAFLEKHVLVDTGPVALGMIEMRLELASLTKDFREAQLKVEATRSALASVTEEKRAKLADDAIVPATFTKRERMAALVISSLGLFLAALLFYLAH